MDLPAGIDLIEFKKAAAFYKTHRKRLSSYFTEDETDFILKSSRPHESLASLLAAKEAVFKTLSAPWMGPSGFRNIRIFPRKKQEFSFELTGNFKKFSSSFSRAKIILKRHRNYVVAHCHP